MTRDEVRFHFLRNALYHTARRRVLESWARWTTFLILVVGTSAAANLLGGWGITPAHLGAATAALAAAQFAFDFSGRAKAHEMLQLRYYEALAEVERRPVLTEEECAVEVGRLATLAAQEPPVYRALDALAYNEATDALYGDAAAKDRLVVPFWCSVTRHFLYHNGVDFRPVGHSEASA